MDFSDYGFDELYEIVPWRIYQVYSKDRVIRMFVTRTLESGHTLEWQNRYDELTDMGKDRVWKQLLGVPDTRAASDERSCVAQGLSWLANYLGLQGR